MSRLLQQLGVLRWRAMRLLAVYGLGRTAATVMAGAIILGLVDYLIRYQDRGLRVLSTLGLVGILVWDCYRYLYGILSHRLSDAELARRVQCRYPELGDSLLSAVEFLRQPEDDPTAGSAALRRAVIAETTACSETLDFTAALDPRPSLRAALATLSLGLLAAGLIVLDPPACHVAIARLVNPFGSTAWPRNTYLQLRRPVDQVARGQPFEVEVIDPRGAKLPPEVRIHYRGAGAKGSVWEETERMRFLAGAMVARRENVTRPFSYRVEGGDDQSMPWIGVKLVEPPLVESLTVQLTPPAYTGWPPHESDRQIRALLGTQIHFSGRSTRPLQSAVLAFQDGRRITAVLDDERRFHLPGKAAALLVDRSQAYWFTLSDRDGSIRQDSDRWEIRALRDSPPSVTIEQPADDTFVTPQATLPLRILAKDDLALREVTLALSRSDRAASGESRVTIYRGPPRAVGAMAGESRLLEYPWELTPLDLRPGTEITFSAMASDYRPGVGKSGLRRVRVITAEELQNRIAAREGLVLAELAQVLHLQQDNRAQVAAPAARFEASGRLEQFDVDHLQGATLNQRQIDRALTGRSEGVVRHIRVLLDDLDQNKVDSPDVRRRMQGLLAEIAQLQQRHLPQIGQGLTTAIKAAQVALADRAAAGGGEQPQKSPPPPDRLVATALGSAVEHQDQVIAALAQMLGQLSQWDNYRRFYREVAEMVRQQEELARRTAVAARTTLAQEPKDLQPQQVADLKLLAREELELALRLEQLQEALRQAGQQMADSDPLAADTVADAAAEIQRRGISGAMRSTLANLQQNQMGQATQRQKQILQDLDEVLDILSGRRQHELARLLKRLTEAETQLAAIANRQAGLNPQLAAAGRQSAATRRREQLDRLGGQQAGAADEARRLARRLERLLADRASQATQRAAGQMDQSAAAAHQADAAAASGRCQQAQASLAEALGQLKARLRQAETDLAGEEISRLQGLLQQLHEQQRELFQQTRDLDAAHADQRPWPADALAPLERLATQQQSLKDKTLRLRENYRGNPFGLVLSGAADDMDRASGLLDRRETGPPTQQSQQNALRRLALALSAMTPEPAAKAEAEGRGGQGSGKQGSSGKQLTLAELKLLKSLQQEINRRTAQLERAYGPRGAMDPEAGRQYADLARDQADLAELVGQLVESLAEPSPGTDAAPIESRAILGTGANAGLSSSAETRVGKPPVAPPRSSFNPRPKRTAGSENVPVSPSAASAPEPSDLLDRSLFEPHSEQQPKPASSDPQPPHALEQADWPRQLLRELAPAGASEEENPLAIIVRQMRQSHQQILHAESGRPTQAVQQQIVAELDRLIQQAGSRGGESQAQPQPAASASQRGPSAQQPSGVKPGQPPGSSTKKPPAAGQPPQPPDVAKIRGMMENTWGELPRKQRERMLQSAAEEFLPEYESMLEAYFQRLAAPPEKKP